MGWTTITKQTPSIWKRQHHGGCELTVRCLILLFVSSATQAEIYYGLWEFMSWSVSLISVLSSTSRRSQGAVRVADFNPRRFAMKLHGWFHYSLQQIRQLTKRASLLTPELDKALVQVVEPCDVCPMTGSNIGSRGCRKVSLSKILHAGMNRYIDLDHVSHVVSMSPTVREVLCLAMGFQSSGYGETPPVQNKELPVAVVCFKQTWMLRHGAQQISTSNTCIAGRIMIEFCQEPSIE